MKRLLALLFSLLVPHEAHAAVACAVGTTSQGEFPAATSSSGALNFTVVGGANHLLVVLQGFASNPGALGTATWNGTSMTTAAGSPFCNGAGGCVAIYYLLNPAAGNNLFAQSWATSVRSSPQGEECSVVNTSTPVANINSATGTSATAAATITTVNGDAAIAMMVNNNVGISTRSQTEMAAIAGSTNIYDGNFGLASGASVVFSWVLTGSATWVVAGLNIKAGTASGGGGGLMISGSGQ
jgi:hypothetical protein